MDSVKAFGALGEGSNPSGGVILEIAGGFHFFSFCSKSVAPFLVLIFKFNEMFFKIKTQGKYLGFSNKLLPFLIISFNTFYSQINGRHQHNIN